MIQGRFVLLSCMVLLLVSCGKSDPIVLPADHQDLYGVWERTEITDNGLGVNNMLLAFHNDNTVTYARCFKKVNKSYSESLPGLNLIRFEGQEIDIQIGWGIFTWTKHLTINKFPYQENGQSYIDVGGVKLRKLAQDERSDYANWPCNRDDNKSERKPLEIDRVSLDRSVLQ